ncbi:MAG: hypothetical protein M1267_05700 [Candidatus Thermoplasmatota archaeon]|nr:hypothetical protein [Candidatus Thermoplasmatota archaeon]MCL5800408.1 hypothetical protein [Candidatus Thermoplasmatota archaeon]
MNQKISISLDENIVKLIDMERGDIPRSRYIENVLKSAGSLFEVLWIFSDEFNSISSRERWGSAHASQPIGKPLHKHEGYLSASGDSLRFYNRNMDLIFAIGKDSIKNLTVEYDDVFRRLRDSRGLLPPMKLSLEDKSVYMFTKPIGKKRIRGDRMFRGENEAITAWFRNPVQG